MQLLASAKSASNKILCGVGFSLRARADLVITRLEKLGVRAHVRKQGLMISQLKKFYYVEIWNSET